MPHPRLERAPFREAPVPPNRPYSVRSGTCREYSPYSAYKSMSDESDQDMTYEMAKGLYQQSGGAATGNGSE